MSRKKIIRAWKDEEYRLSLSDTERAEILPSPVGMIELSDEALLGIAGARTENWLTLGCCFGTLAAFTDGCSCGRETVV